jgi:hypothetical protein
MRIVAIAAEAFHSLRFLFLPARRLFSHFVSFIIDSHCFPFVGPNTDQFQGIGT